MPRLVLVSRRFWPLVGGAEVMMARLAAGFHERGAAITVLTARWQADWPPDFDHRGVRVVRLQQGGRRWWGTWRYMRTLSTWLREHRSRYDLAYVSMLKHDAYAVLGAARALDFPVALRAEGAGTTGDCFWQLEANFGRRIKKRCREASALIAPSPAIERELVAAGYPRERIHYLPNGVPLPPARDDAARSEAQVEARATLAEGNPAFAVPPGAPVVVYTGRLHPRKGLDYLLLAWAKLAPIVPAARLWIVGEGEFHRALDETLARLQLAGSVRLAGAYDEVDDFLAAADLFVLPSLEEGMSLSLLEAMAAGLGVAATDIPANRVLVRDGVDGRLFAAADVESLAQLLAELLQDRAQLARLGAQARESVRNSYSLDRRVDDHLQLFDRLLSRS
jgi:glycosyltransferase involved in cell wall biosynthesis